MDTAQRLEVTRPSPVLASPAEARVPAGIEHFVVCMECGQGYDNRNLPHALYHAEPDHDPFFVES